MDSNSLRLRREISPVKIRLNHIIAELYNATEQCDECGCMDLVHERENRTEKERRPAQRGSYGSRTFIRSVAQHFTVCVCCGTKVKKNERHTSWEEITVNSSNNDIYIITANTVSTTGELIFKPP